MTEEIKSPLGSDFGKSRPLRTLILKGFQEKKCAPLKRLRGLHLYVNCPHVLITQVFPRHKLSGDGYVKEDNGVYSFEIVRFRRRDAYCSF